MELNNIYNMDCLDGMKLIQDRSIDLILCDLPFGTTDIMGWDKIIPMEKLWVEYLRLISNEGNIVLFGSQPFTSYLVNSNPKMFRYEWIWDKTKGANFLNANCQPLKTHENILVFSKLPASPNKKGNARYYPQKTEGESYTYSHDRKTTIVNGGMMRGTGEKTMNGRHPKSIQTFKKDGRLHPTQKPVDLCEFIIKTYTKEGDLVLDNCMGSGTTAIACIRTKRNFIGFELEKSYHEIAIKRIEKEIN